MVRLTKKFAKHLTIIADDKDKGVGLPQAEVIYSWLVTSISCPVPKRAERFSLQNNASTNQSTIYND